MGIGGIPFEAMSRYAELKELDEDEFEELLFHIKRLDAVFLEHMKNV